MRDILRWKSWSLPNKTTAIVAAVTFLAIALLTVLMLVAAGDAPKGRLEAALCRGALEIEVVLTFMTWTIAHAVFFCSKALMRLARAVSSGFMDKLRRATIVA